MHNGWRERIIVNPKILVGKPVVEGTRIGVDFILELLAHGWTNEKILKNYPQLKEEDIHAALEYSAHEERKVLITLDVDFQNSFCVVERRRARVIPLRETKKGGN